MCWAKPTKNKNVFPCKLNFSLYKVEYGVVLIAWVVDVMHYQMSGSQTFLWVNETSNLEFMDNVKWYSKLLLWNHMCSSFQPSTNALVTSLNPGIGVFIPKWLRAPPNPNLDSFSLTTVSTRGVRIKYERAIHNLLWKVACLRFPPSELSTRAFNIQKC